MKQPRRWAMTPAALLMAVSLAYAPCEGSTRPIPRLVPGDPQPTQEMGEPDIPPNTGPLVCCRVWFSSVLLAKGIRVGVVIVPVAPKCAAGSDLARCTLRPAARP